LILIPQWIHANAKYWHDNQITDSTFAEGIQYLIQQKIMKVPPTLTGSKHSTHIPTWVKNNAGYWASGQISDDVFVQGIQYLIEQGIIQV
jgi:hypothetical protein